MEIDYQYYRKLLELKKVELEALISSTQESTKPVELDSSSMGRLSRMDAIQMQQMALAAKHRRQQEARRIEAAFKRIDNETYGYCMNCDEPITSKRLEWDPTVLNCIKCASKTQ